MERRTKEELGHKKTQIVSFQKTGYDSHRETGCGLSDWKRGPTECPRMERRDALWPSNAGTQTCLGTCRWSPWQLVARRGPGGRSHEGGTLGRDPLSQRSGFGGAGLQGAPSMIDWVLELAPAAATGDFLGPMTRKSLVPSLCHHSLKDHHYVSVLPAAPRPSPYSAQIFPFSP